MTDRALPEAAPMTRGDDPLFRPDAFVRLGDTVVRGVALGLILVVLFWAALLVLLGYAWSLMP